MSTGAGLLPIDESIFDFSFETALQDDDTIVSLPHAIFHTLGSMPLPVTPPPLVVPSAHLDKIQAEHNDIARAPCVTMQDLFSPLAPLVRWLDNERDSTRLADEGKVTWQHKLLYQGRSYMPRDFLDALSRTGRLNLSRISGFKPYSFYRRLIMNFEENWNLITPLLCRSPHGDSGSGVCAFLLMPFVFVSYRLSPQSVALYQEQIQNGQSPTWSAVLGPASLSTLQLPTDIDLLRSPPTLSSTNSERLQDAFGAQLFAYSRIVTRGVCRQHPCIFHALHSAAQDRTLSLISSQPLALFLSKNRKYRLFFLLGGKDMLALDWLPFVSQTLKAFSILTLHSTNDAQQGCRFNLGFLMYEYPGYGFRSGVSSPQSCTEAALKTLSEAVRRFPDDSEISLTLLGYSLGSAIALRVARALTEGCEMVAKCVQLKNITLLAPITRVAECAAYLLQVPKPFQAITANAIAWLQDPSVAWDTQKDLMALVDYIAQNIEAYEDFSMDIFHGDCDDMVSPTLSRGLLESARERLALHRKFTKSSLVADKLNLLYDHVQFHDVVGANHLSLASSEKFTASICKSLFDREFVEPITIREDVYSPRRLRQSFTI